VAFIKDQPVEVDEVRRLADEYNTSLRRTLGSPPGGPSTTSSAPPVTLEVRPALFSGGGGLQLVASF
jgi:hypothetical protein